MPQTSLRGSGDPLDAVRTWWRAWERRDTAALDSLALYDYFEFTGSADRHTSHSPRMSSARSSRKWTEPST